MKKSSEVTQLDAACVQILPRRFGFDGRSRTKLRCLAEPNWVTARFRSVLVRARAESIASKPPFGTRGSGIILYGIPSSMVTSVGRLPVLQQSLIFPPQHFLSNIAIYIVHSQEQHF